MKKSIYQNMPRLVDEMLDTGQRFGGEGNHPLVCQLGVEVDRLMKTLSLLHVAVDDDVFET